MSYRVTLIPGDGTGPEIAEVTKEVLGATGVVIDWESLEAGESAMAKKGTPLPGEVLDSIRKNRVALKGPITTPIGTGFRSVNVALRHELDLYACVRPCKLYPGVRSPYKQIDLVVVRENSEDLYTGVEFSSDSVEAKQIAQWGQGKIKPRSAVSIKHISPSATERIVTFAFEYAVKHKRRKVTAITKANIMKLSDGLFLATARTVAEGYKGKVEYEERLVDNMCMQLVMKPELYDV
ncbi:MAG: isocitrate/isopropylmalate dehydrogenase family protein, partial [Elusimicrobia bacterium]|nr:isocitrate/isopropylmalate dehydrogenase family protein [Elusimicrobiota bacterium]